MEFVLSSLTRIAIHLRCSAKFPNLIIAGPPALNLGLIIRGPAQELDFHDDLWVLIRERIRIRQIPAQAIQTYLVNISCITDNCLQAQTPNTYSIYGQFARDFSHVIEADFRARRACLF